MITLFLLIMRESHRKVVSLHRLNEAEILKAIDEHWEELNQRIDDVFAGKKITIKRIK